MTRLSALTLTLSLGVIAPATEAQSPKKESLESSYARLCANGQQSEACDVLRAALRRKLSDGTSATGSSNPAKSARSSAVSPRWGFWSQLAGTTWLADNGTLYSYTWQRRGEVLGAEVIAANLTYEPVITPSADGSSLNLRIGSTTYALRPDPDGSFTQALSNTRRTRYKLSGNQMTLTDEAFVGGQWVPGQAPPITRRRLETSEIGGYRASLAQRRQEVEAMISRDWGILPRLVGEKFLYTSAEYPQYNSAVTFNWVDRGRGAYVSWTWLASGAVAGWTRFMRDTVTGKIEARDDKRRRGDVTMTADGRIRIAWDASPETRGYGDAVTDWYLAGGRLHSDGYFVKKGKKKHSSTTTYATVTGRSNEQLKIALAQQRQQAAQTAQAAPAKKKSGGLAGALKGAVGGMAGVSNAGGGLSEVMVGGAVGAVAGGAGVDAGTISASTAAFAEGSTAGGAGASGGAASAAGARYPTKPNALSGQAACAMMNESNYRQVGLSGGNDAQLKTMCAQAYEYYVAYKRAIAQGYAEADANRTYAAHAQSARVAIHFYQNNR